MENTAIDFHEIETEAQNNAEMYKALSEGARLYLPL